MRLGADPEVFLVDKTLGTFVSSIGKIGGNKQFPLQIVNKPKGFTLQEDNVALEFGIPPAGSSTSFVKHIKTVMQSGQEFVGESLEFSKLSCVQFSKEELNHPLAQQFGCEPDFNAWTGQKNDKPNGPFNVRSAGGHVHIETSLPPDLMGQALDLFLGIPSLVMDKNGAERRKLYGKAGSIRYKPYGLEYRVLSNFWIFTPKHIRWVWDQCHRAAASVTEGFEVPNAVEHVINNGDITLAKYLIKEHSLNVC